jgi:hypothetical protein
LIVNELLSINILFISKPTSSKKKELSNLVFISPLSLSAQILRTIIYTIALHLDLLFSGQVIKT